MNDILKLKDIPQELKMNAIWCGWKLTKTGKVPFNVITDKFAKSNDPSTFVSYPTLLHNIHKYLFEDSKESGIGLGIFRGYSAVDIDHCVDENGIISDMALDIIKYCNSYTEYSPSGTGIRIVFKTMSKIDNNLFYINNHNIGLEIYISDNTNKFVTITGNKISGDVINEINIDYILQKYMKKNVQIVTNTTNNEHIDLNIPELLKKDKKLEELWNDKNHELVNGNSQESNKDAALCCKLSYYLKDNKSEIVRYFKMSPYYLTKDDAHKKKWERQDYIDRTVSSSISFIENNLPVKKESATYDLTDTGNAHRFVDKFGDILRYNVDNKMWMIWNGKYWQYDLAEEVKNYIEIIAEEMLQEAYNIRDLPTQTRNFRNIEKIYSSAGKESLLKEARHLSGMPVYNADFDSNPYLFCFKNGVLDLRTGELREPRKEDMISQIAGSDIDTSKKPEKLLKMLNDMWPDEPEKINFLHRWFGYCMTNDACEQKYLMVQSDGNSGKSLLFDIINEAMGGYGITADSDLITDNTYKGNNLEQIARLKGKRFVFIDEIDENSYMKEKLLKDLTSGIGKMVGRYLYANSTEFQFRGKLNIATNYEMRIKGVDKGVWRRTLLLKTKLDVTGKENKHLREELLEELPYICGWLYEGFKLYSESGLQIPNSVINEISEYRKENDTVQQWVEECCEVGNGYFEKASVLFDNYKLFMYKRDQKTNMTSFGRNLGKKFEKHHYSSGYVYIGIRIRKGEENLSKKVAYDNLKIFDDNI